MRRTVFRAPAIVALVTVLSACGKGSGSSAGQGGLTGKVVVSGSSTVQPISSLVAEEFSAQNPDVSVKVDGPGTGDGFELFCKGETDVSDASRPIKDEEAQACQAAGINYVELEIGLDGLTVMTNPNNEAVSCLNKGDLYALIGPESEGFANWSDANVLGREVGGRALPYPNLPLDITAPGEESGTYDAFIELALKDIADERGQDETARPDYQSSPNDNVIIQGIEGSDSSLGWVGFAYAEGTEGQVKELQIDGGDGCVAPNRETIADASYPLSRALYIYVNSDNVKANEALKSYVDLYMEGMKEFVVQAGYVELPADRVQATQSKWSSEAA